MEVYGGANELIRIQEKFMKAEIEYFPDTDMD
jgi:hypothetical protein